MFNFLFICSVFVCYPKFYHFLFYLLVKMSSSLSTNLNIFYYWILFGELLPTCHPDKMGNGRSCGQSQEPYGTDEACLTFFAQENLTFNVLSQSTECEGCDLIQIKVSQENFITCNANSWHKFYLCLVRCSEWILHSCRHNIRHNFALGIQGGWL